MRRSDRLDPSITAPSRRKTAAAMTPAVLRRPMIAGPAPMPDPASMTLRWLQGLVRQREAPPGTTAGASSLRRGGLQQLTLCEGVAQVYSAQDCAATTPEVIRVPAAQDQRQNSWDPHSSPVSLILVRMSWVQAAEDDPATHVSRSWCRRPAHSTGTAGRHAMVEVSAVRGARHAGCLCWLR